jgi:hypothetical protein
MENSQLSIYPLPKTTKIAKNHPLDWEKSQFFLKAPGPLSPSERGVLNHSQEEKQMEAEARMATPKQLAYIERLRTDIGTTIDKPLGELTVSEASELIEDLIQKLIQTH